MPCATIDYSEAHAALTHKDIEAVDGPCYVSTPFGLVLLEIQGELNLPDAETCQSPGIDDGRVGSFAKLDKIHDAICFGKMSFDDKDPSKVVLFVGKSQRLVGRVESLPEPLGVLRVPAEEHQENLKLIDIIEKKIVFKDRPLPVM